MPRWTKDDGDLLENEQKSHLRTILEPLNVPQWITEIENKFRVQPPAIKRHFHKLVKTLVDREMNIEEKFRIVFLTDSQVSEEQEAERSRGHPAIAQPPILQPRQVSQMPQVFAQAQSQNAHFGLLSSGPVVLSNQSGQSVSSHNVSSPTLAPTTSESRSSQGSSKPRDVELKPLIAREEDEDPDLTGEEKRANAIDRRKRKAAEIRERGNAKKPSIPRSTRNFYQLLEPLFTGLVSLVQGNQNLCNYLMKVGNSLVSKKTELEAKIADDGASEFIINALFASGCREIIRVTDDTVDLTDYVSPKAFFGQLISLARAMQLKELEKTEAKIAGNIRELEEDEMIPADKLQVVIPFVFAAHCS